MNRFWKRGRDGDLETQLRAARHEPADELVRAISGRVRPPRARRRSLGLAGGLTVLVLAPVLALGGGSAAVGAVKAQLHLTPAKNVVIAAPALTQYGNTVNTCVLNRIQVRLPRGVANLLVALKLAKLGTCKTTVTARAAALKQGPLTTVCVLDKLKTNLPTKLVKQIVKLDIAERGSCDTRRA